MSDEKRTSAASREVGHLRFRSHKIRIEVASGPDAGTVKVLDGPVATVGSGECCDLSLSDKTVSRRHLLLHVEQDPQRRTYALRVVDEGSRNGTLLDGVHVKEAYARPGSLIAIGETTLRTRMLSEIVRLPLAARDSFGALKGRSVVMRRLYALLERVAAADAPVLIEGECGTGKELAARAIHEASRRAPGPFVPINCAAIPETLLESELFGHERGAFNDARERVGLFEAAERGTLFLDEIGELPLGLQPKLLRAIQEREIRRVGSNKLRRVDVRIVAATNRSLARDVDRGRFREDLYHRLAVLEVRMPALVERADDIPLLIREIEKELRGEAGGERLSDALVNELAARNWPGNVRELRNEILRAILLGGPESSADSSFDPPLPPLSVDIGVPLMEARERLIDAFERAYLERALAATGGNVTRAAEIARVGRRFVQERMARHGLREVHE